MMNKTIVITSILPPTEAVELFASLPDYSVIVVGDKRTPSGWQCRHVEYLAPDGHESLGFILAGELPYNHYSRKMIGYLRAIQEGATCIVDADDDNIPKADWNFPDFTGTFDCVSGLDGFVNIYQLFTDSIIWPRGLPLNLITRKFQLEESLQRKNCRVGIWQGLADEDPDVDAIYRLTRDTPCYFRDREPVVLEKGVLSPFNTQNTITRKELFPMMYLPTSVSFRFTDILRSLVSQPIMWLYGYQLGFVKATVVQKRNPHDYVKDFISEIPMYRHCESVIEVVSSSISPTESIESNLYRAYDSLRLQCIVPDKELTTLEAWLNDLRVLR